MVQPDEILRESDTRSPTSQWDEYIRELMKESQEQTPTTEISTKFRDEEAEEEQRTGLRRGSKTPIHEFSLQSENLSLTVRSTDPSPLVRHIMREHLRSAEGWNVGPAHQLEMETGDAESPSTLQLLRLSAAQYPEATIIAFGQLGVVFGIGSAVLNHFVGHELVDPRVTVSTSILGLGTWLTAKLELE